MREPSVQMDLSATGSAPVQIEGTVDGYPFYFRARHDEWSFAIALDPAVDVYDVYGSWAGAFYREGFYGQRGKTAASYMPIQDAVHLIEQCVREFADERVVVQPPVTPK